MFSKDIDKILNHIEDQAYDLVQNVAMDVIGDLTSEPPIGTPRDTHTATNSWRFSTTDNISTNFTEPTYNEAAAALIKQNRSLSLIEKDKLLGSNEIWLVNDRYYIGYLNNGSESRPPALFVEGAVYRAQTKYYHR